MESTREDSGDRSSSPPLPNRTASRPSYLSRNARASCTSNWSTAGRNPRPDHLQPLLGEIREQQQEQPMHPSDHNFAFIDDGYSQLNPQYAQPEALRVWGLGRPFPRIVRPGMQVKEVEEAKRRIEQKKKPEPEEDSQQQADDGEGKIPNGEVARNDVQSIDGASTAGDFGQGPPGGPARWTEAEAQEREKAGKEKEEIHGEPPEGGGKTQQQQSEDEEDEDEEVTEYLNRWCEIRFRLREPLAEWLATMLTIFLGTCVNLQVTVSKNEYGDYQQKSWGWGFATMLGIYVAGGVSGAHLNPTLSTALSLFRGFPAKHCIIYIIAQLLGALCGCLLAYGLYKDALHTSDPELHVQTTGIAFFTMPHAGITLTTAFFNEVAAAAVLAGTILALGDESNSPPGAGMHAFVIGLDVSLLLMATGYNTGPSISPAKDLAGRLVCWWVGYGTSMWDRGWWILSIVGSIFGGVLGCALYDLVVFVGGESPINYPKGQRRRVARKGRMRVFNAYKNRKRRWQRDLEAGQGKDAEKGE